MNRIQLKQLFLLDHGLSLLYYLEVGQFICMPSVRKRAMRWRSSHVCMRTGHLISMLWFYVIYASYTTTSPPVFQALAVLGQHMFVYLFRERGRVFTFEAVLFESKKLTAI